MTDSAFPIDILLPSHIVGIISLVLLAAAILARYAFRLAGFWRSVYVIGAGMRSPHLNVFVLIVQLFQKVPPPSKRWRRRSRAAFGSDAGRGAGGLRRADHRRADPIPPRADDLRQPLTAHAWKCYRRHHTAWEEQP